MSDKEKLKSFVLMERIGSINHDNYIISPKTITKKQPVLTELGIFGVLLGWSITTFNYQLNSHLKCIDLFYIEIKRMKIIFNEVAGYSNSTKSIGLKWSKHANRLWGLWFNLFQWVVMYHKRTQFFGWDSILPKKLFFNSQS